MTELEKAFEKAAWDYVKECKKLGYHPTYTIDMMTRMGAVAAARHMLDHSPESTGLTELYLKHRLDLSVEAMALDELFRDLFTVAQRNEARRRLRELKHPVSPDEADSAD